MRPTAAWVAVVAAWGAWLAPASGRAGEPVADPTTHASRAAVPRQAQLPAAEPRTRGGALPELAPLARAALPAVVGVFTSAAPTGAPDDLRELLGKAHPHPTRQGLASGFVVDPQGFVVTNAHVVEGAKRVEVDLGDEGGKVPARVVGADPATDVALLKVDAGRALPVLALGDSDRLEIADWVLVVGNPFGLSHTVTLGIVSQVGRSEIAPLGKDGYYDFIQTDASINPGNSGGPLLNLRGEVVGIATAINATGQGIGFAVPINMARDVLAQLRAHGKVVRSWMGVAVRELPRERGQRVTRRGVVVTSVVDGGPAASAGLAPGDVIVGFDGRTVPSAARLRWFVASAGVGRRVALSVRRGTAERAVQVELGEIPKGELAARAQARAASDEEP